MENSNISYYQLWFHYGRPRKMGLSLLLPLLQDAKLIEMDLEGNDPRCKFITENPQEDTYQAIKAYRERWLPYQIWYYFRAKKRWKEKYQGTRQEYREKKTTYIGQSEEERVARNFRFSRRFWVACAVGSILIMDEYMGIVFVCSLMYIATLLGETNYLLAKFLNNQSQK